MPKISNNDIKIYHKDINKPFRVEIYYNQEFGFYAAIPKTFFDIVHHMSRDEHKSFFIEKKATRDELRAGKYAPVVTAPSENECLERMKKLLSVLVDKSIEQRKVIILFYKPLGETRYNDHRTNQQHPLIGFEIGLTYAIETSVDGNTVYSTYREYESFGEKRVDRKELNLWNEAAKIIPDTEQNRATLEHLYARLKDLQDKIADFTATPELLIEFIQSNVKLLG